MLVIEKTGKKSLDGCFEWKCLCDCGQEILISLNKIKHGSQKCEKCWRKNGAKLLSTGIEELSGKYISRIKSGAKKRNLKFTITNSDLWNLFLKQDKKCAISGIIICLGGKPGERIQQTASLDRIDSTKGYTLDNVQWTHKIVNMMKQELSDSDFINWCKIIAKNN